MNMKKIIKMVKYLIVIVFFFAFENSGAQNLVYTPKNPAFGGNPYNSQWLLASAEAQNSFTDKSETGRGRLSEMERLAQSLNSQLLSQITRKMFSNQFGSEGLTPGTYKFGSLALDIYPSQDGLVIDILNTDTGEQTQIIIPNT
jgi:curli production assembly/transport component CsgF